MTCLFETSLWWHIFFIKLSNYYLTPQVPYTVLSKLCQPCYTLHSANINISSNGVYIVVNDYWIYYLCEVVFLYSTDCQLLVLRLLKTAFALKYAIKYCIAFDN